MRREEGVKNNLEDTGLRKVLQNKYEKEWYYDTDLLVDLYKQTFRVATQYPYVRYLLVKTLTDDDYAGDSLVHIVKKMYSTSDEYSIMCEDLVNIADEIKMCSR